MRLRTMGLGLAALACWSTSMLASAETWRFGIEEIRGGIQHQYAEHFKSRIEEESGGDIEVQLLPYGVWGSTYSVLYDAIQSGAIQIGFGSGALGGTVPESQLFTLNYVMPPNTRQTVEVLNSPEFLESDAWQQAFRQRGLVPLSTLTEGFQVWSADQPINTPADMRSLPIRVMDNSILLSTYRAYGAAPVSIAFGELYSALQQGQAEAAIQPVFTHENMGFYEVQDYLIFAGQSQLLATLMANESWWQSLTPAQRTMVEDVVGELVDTGHDIQQRFNENSMASITSDSDIQIIRLNADQRSAFRELARPVRQTYIDETGPLGEQALNQLLEQLGSDSASQTAGND